MVAASFLCSLCFLLFILFFVFMLASIVTHFRRGEPRNTRNTRKVGKDNDPGLPVGCLRFPPVVLPPPARPPYKHAALASGSGVSGTSFRVLNGPTRLRFELLRAGASPLQARSASKWIGCFGPCRRTAAKPPWSAGTCSRFLVYSRPQTLQFARPRSPNSNLRSPTPCVLMLEIVIVFVFPSVPSVSSCSFSSLSSCWRQS